MYQNALKRSSVVQAVYHTLRRASQSVGEMKDLWALWLKSHFPVSWDSNSNIIISLTSFPARIERAWIAIESLMQQDIRPHKVVLVLSQEEFPSRELPMALRRQQARGLEILWVPQNTRSYKKLLPTRERYPDAWIMTADDDVRYDKWRLRRLVDAASSTPGTVIGHSGWEITVEATGIAPYVSWPPAGPHTPPNRCLLTGVGGVLYPPHALPSHLLLDIDLALATCPVADDIWFWAVAQ